MVGRCAAIGNGLVERRPRAPCPSPVRQVAAQHGFLQVQSLYRLLEYAHLGVDFTTEEKAPPLAAAGAATAARPHLHLRIPHLVPDSLSRICGTASCRHSRPPAASEHHGRGGHPFPTRQAQPAQDDLVWRVQPAQDDLIWQVQQAQDDVEIVEGDSEHSYQTYFADDAAQVRAQMERADGARAMEPLCGLWQTCVDYATLVDYHYGAIARALGRWNGMARVPNMAGVPRDRILA